MFVDILETKVAIDDPLPVHQVRELYKACLATGRNFTTIHAASHIICHTIMSCSVLHNACQKKQCGLNSDLHSSENILEHENVHKIYVQLSPILVGTIFLTQECK